jgi:hypothetical protein
MLIYLAYLYETASSRHEIMGTVPGHVAFCRDSWGRSKESSKKVVFFYPFWSTYIIYNPEQPATAMRSAVTLLPAFWTRVN